MDWNGMILMSSTRHLIFLNWITASLHFILLRQLITAMTDYIILYVSTN